MLASGFYSLKLSLSLSLLFGCAMRMGSKRTGSSPLLLVSGRFGQTSALQCWQARSLTYLLCCAVATSVLPLASLHHSPAARQPPSSSRLLGCSAGSRAPFPTARSGASSNGNKLSREAASRGSTQICSPRDLLSRAQRCEKTPPSSADIRLQQSSKLVSLGAPKVKFVLGRPFALP